MNRGLVETIGYWIQIVLWLFVCLSWRPGLIGHNWIWIVFCLGLIWVLINRPWSNFIRDSGKEFLFMMFWSIYFLFHEGFLGHIQIAVQVFLTDFACYYIMASGFRKYKAYNILLAFIVFAFAIVFSSLITYALYGITFSKNAPLFEAPIKGYDANFRGYFPFTLIYQQEYSIGGNSGIARCIGLFREPGIYQAVLNSGIVSLAFVKDRRIRHFALIAFILGVFSTMSTAGIAGLIISLTIYSFLRNAKRSMLVLPIIIGLSFITGLADLIMNTENIGIASKLADSSGEDRMLAVHQFMRYWADAGVFGITNDVTFSNVTSLTGTLPLFFLRFGIAGVILSIFQVVAYWRNVNNMPYYLIYFPVFFSALTSQPIWATNISVFFCCLGGTLASQSKKNGQLRMVD